MNEELKKALEQSQAVIVKLFDGNILLGWPMLLPDASAFKLYDDKNVHTVAVTDVEKVTRLIV
ncbi:hypothetical protein OIN60_08950 [Paenibacillus sp. P96]|uniref:Uncharacterized protein n=1 Tax=Paenibacillus zeirhizosphaerae TaxID=2987519 RepID=A0ABT9FQA2_9BACL|nr:hypothetical protein [Paenibacillus sp. P96]MDP4096898.1 hypothetical protein [Paenibacillus sp. P96]